LQLLLKKGTSPPESWHSKPPSCILTPQISYNSIINIFTASSIISLRSEILIFFWKRIASVRVEYRPRSTQEIRCIWTLYVLPENTKIKRLSLFN
jgi:hypothetical protein